MISTTALNENNVNICARDKYFKKDQPIFERLDQDFKEIIDTIICGNSVYDSLITKYINRNTVSKYNSISRILTTRKLYVPKNNSVETMSDENNIQYKLLSQPKVLLVFWKYCDANINAMADSMVNSYFKELENMNNESIKVDRNLWFDKYKRYNVALRCIEPIIGYTFQNYRLLIKNIPRYMGLYRYGDRILLHTLSKRLGDNWKCYLSDLLSYLMDGTKQTCDTYIKTIPLKEFVEVNDCIDEETIHEFYIKFIKQYFTKKVIIPNSAFFETMKEYLYKNEVIIRSVSEQLYKETDSMIGCMVVMKEGLIDDLYENACLNNTPEAYQHFKDVTLNFICQLYEDDEKYDELHQVISKFALNQIEKIYYPSKDVGELFNGVVNLKNRVPISYFPKFLVQHMKDMIGGGDIRLSEQYIRYYEILIKSASESNASKINDIEERMANFRMLVKVLGLKSPVLILFSRSLFRQYLIDPAYIGKSVIDGESYISMIVSYFESCFDRSQEIIELASTKEEIQRSYRFYSEYKINNGDNLIVDPIIVNRSKVPAIFQENNEQPIKLPSDLQKTWNEFLEYFDNHDLKGDMKTLYPYYHLHRCEVSSPFILPNGNSLVLDLTLFQATVLNQFNDHESLSLHELHKETEMDKITLQVTLKSFISGGLLIKKEDKFIFNEYYKPDQRRIKHGKIRYALPKVVTRASSSTSSASNTTAPSIEHPEGLSSQWKQELLKACIVRSLKGEMEGLNDASLKLTVDSQIQGFSVGEFKDTIQFLLRDKFISSTDGLYKYV